MIPRLRLAIDMYTAAEQMNLASAMESVDWVVNGHESARPGLAC